MCHLISRSWLNYFIYIISFYFRTIFLHPVRNCTYVIFIIFKFDLSSSNLPWDIITVVIVVLLYCLMSYWHLNDSWFDIPTLLVRDEFLPDWILCWICHMRIVSNDDGAYFSLLISNYDFTHYPLSSSKMGILNCQVFFLITFSLGTYSKSFCFGTYSKF